MSKFIEKTISSEMIFKGNILNLKLDTIKLPNEKEATREFIEHSGGVCVVALDENENIFLVSQYRYPYREEILEIPAGKLSPGEDPLECAKRELLEETGLVAEKYISLGLLYPTPAYVNEVIHMYLATELTQKMQQLDEDEFLSVEKMSLKEAVEKVMNGEIKDSKSQTAILKSFIKYSINN